jgi:adenylate kinase
LYIILLGAPGAGKGTQAVMLAEKLKLVQVASGDLFRQAPTR